MATSEEKNTLALAIAADLADLIPPLPGIDFIGQVVDAATTQRIRSTFPQEKGSTIPSLLEAVEIPFVSFIPVVGPMIAKIPDLLPGHTLGVLRGLEERYGSLKGSGLKPPALPAPPPPPPLHLPAVKVPPPPKVEIRGASLHLPPPPSLRVTLPELPQVRL